MRRLANFLVAALVALTLAGCAAATNPVVEHGDYIGTESLGP